METHACQNTSFCILILPLIMKLEVSPYYKQNTASYLVNSMVPKKIKTCIPKVLVAYFMILQVCFGMNIGFDKMFTGKKQKIIKIVTHLVSILILTILIAPCHILNTMVWFWCYLARYIFHFLAFNCLKQPKYKMFDFLKEMHAIGEKILALESNSVGSVILIYTSVMWFLKGAFVAARCIVGRSNFCNETNMHFFSIYTVFALSGDTCSGILIIILFYVYSFVNHARNSLESDFDVTKFEKRYMTIAECFDKIKPLYNYIFMVELVVNTPRLMDTLRCMLLFIKENREWYSYTSECLFAFHLIIQICIPAVIAQMVNCQADAIQSVLNEQRRVEDDLSKSAELTRVLRYVKARRLQTNIWRLVPADLRLPLLLIQVCTTYFIVILQFTHLYD